MLQSHHAVALNRLANTVPKPIYASFVPSIPILAPPSPSAHRLLSHFCEKPFADLRKCTLFVREFPIKSGQIHLQEVRGLFLIAAFRVQNLTNILLFLLFQEAFQR